MRLHETVMELITMSFGFYLNWCANCELKSERGAVR